MLYVDLTGNTSAEFRIQVKGIHTLTPADFLGVSQASGGAPLPVGDVTSVAADVLLQTSGNVLTNDGGTGLAVTGVSFNGTPGTVGAPLAGTYGALTLNADGTCTFALDNDSLTVQSLAAGQVAQDVFTYAVGNDNGSSEAAITVTIVGWNDDPTAADASVATGEDTPLTSTLPAATDVDGDPVDYFLGSAAGHGTAVVHTDGSFSYTPNAGFNGADTFVYGVSDAFGGLNLYTVTVDVGDRENPAAITGADAMTIAGSGVSNPDWTRFAEVQAATSQVGADAVIDLGNGNTIMLVGVTAANLTAADFVL
jgi:VCBS repeat-containing protein